jgi:hypothetical protein
VNRCGAEHPPAQCSAQTWRKIAIALTDVYPSVNEGLDLHRARINSRHRPFVLDRRAHFPKDESVAVAVVTSP